MKKNNLEEYDNLVYTKFSVYHSLFLNLPFTNIKNIGILLPILQNECEAGLEMGYEPVEILDKFFLKHTDLKEDIDKINFMFNVIQYVERQIVLFDSVEDSAYNLLHKEEANLTLSNISNKLHKIDKNQLLDFLQNFSIRFVLTAHPTQFYTTEVLEIIKKLKLLIAKNDISKINITLQQLGLTSLVNSQSPTPFDEAKNLIYYLRYVYYDAFPKFFELVTNTLNINEFDNYNLLKIGFWPGGDRDGNPFVNYQITQKVSDELKIELIKSYYKDIKKLEKKLTFKEIKNKINDLKKMTYEFLFSKKELNNHNLILNPLFEIRDLLIKNYQSLFIRDLDDLIIKVKTFKLHFATLDIRQDHNIHKHVIEHILIKNRVIKSKIDELDQLALLDVLSNYDIKIDKNNIDDDLVLDTINNINQLKNIQWTNGEQACNRYIISNSEDMFSILFVLALFKWNGISMKDITFDIIPLFETMDGMTLSSEIMKSLFENPIYKNHLENRNNKQTIMLGFSDGTKDGGYLKANWMIYKTKMDLSKLCKEYDIKVVFFDGRGGPPARGGGKTHDFYASLGNLISNNEIQLTIQGQTISSKYSNEQQFLDNSEQMLTAGLSNLLLKYSDKNDSEYFSLMNELSDSSYNKYVSLKEHPKFIPYLENKTTLKYFSQTRIGSRPAKRNSDKKLELKDLRAISFVSAWSQIKQNVPGYYGIGTALNTQIEKGNLTLLQQMYSNFKYFKTLIDNSMMSLSKCNFNLTNYMSKDPEYGEFWNNIYDEFELSIKCILAISKSEILMEKDVVSRKSIELREKIVLPLLITQQSSLQKIELNDTNKELYSKLIIRSFFGNINASRNSV